jgi:hypothetical protein
MGIAASAARSRTCAWGLVALYAATRIAAMRHGAPGIFPDSGTYERIASLPLASGAFFAAAKPWALPLLYKLLPGATAASAPAAQLAVSIVCWVVLAVAVSRCVSSQSLRAVAFAAVLAFSLSASVGLWDADLLSESLSLSLMALLLAALLTLARRPTLLAAAGAVATAALWAGTRDTNAYVVLMLTGAAAGVVWRAGRATLAGVLAAALVAVAGLTIAASASPARSQLLLIDVVNERVLDDPAARSFFVGRGMPVTARLRRTLFARRSTIARYEQDPQLAALRAWLANDGSRTYISYLLKHPDVSIATPLKRLPSMISPSGIGAYSAPGYKAPLPRQIDPGHLPGGLSLLLLSVVLLGAAGFAAARGLAARPWIVPAAALAATVPEAILVWDGEPIEIARHALLVGQTMRIALLILTFFLADAVRRGRVRRPDALRATDKRP